MKDARVQRELLRRTGGILFEILMLLFLFSTTHVSNQKSRLVSSDTQPIYQSCRLEPTFIINQIEPVEVTFSAFAAVIISEVIPSLIIEQTQFTLHSIEASSLALLKHQFLSGTIQINAP